MKDDGRTVIRAVLESDLERLIGIGSTDRASCLICGRQVGDGEIGGFVKLDGELRLFCERATCLLAAKQGNWDVASEGSDADDS